MQYTTLLFEIRDGVAKITLSRPEANNSINLEAARDFMQVVLRCSEDLEVRAIMITGTGSIFCTGGDLKTFSSKSGNLSYYLKETATYFHAAISHLIRMDAPVVVAVNGVAAGAGMSLACAGDIVVMAESARLVAGIYPNWANARRILNILPTSHSGP